MDLHQIDPVREDKERKRNEAGNRQENSLQYSHRAAAQYGSISPIIDYVALWRPRRRIGQKLELSIKVGAHQIEHEGGDAAFRRRHRSDEEDARAPHNSRFFPLKPEIFAIFPQEAPF